MENTIKECLYEDLESFIKSISYGGDLYEIFNSNFIFRGESSEKYRLIPSALRDCNVEKVLRFGNYLGEDCKLGRILGEYAILREFYYSCDNVNLYVPSCNIRKKPFGDVGTPFNYNVWLPEDLYEIAGLAQHYGLPTRLLDWSQDIYVSLYFACVGAMKTTEKNGFSDDRIVLWALNAYETEFENLMNDTAPIFFIRPSYHGNPNLGAQKGLFTLWEFATIRERQVCFEVTPLDDFLRNNSKNDMVLLYKIKLPSRFAPRLYTVLNRLGYNAARLFPGYQGVSQKISEDLLCERILKMLYDKQME